MRNVRTRSLNLDNENENIQLGCTQDYKTHAHLDLVNASLHTHIADNYQEGEEEQQKEEEVAGIDTVEDDDAMKQRW